MSMSTSRYCWCGIYTRQSRESRSEFTSCQAQFEACFEFLRARFGEGWVHNGCRYDDERGSSENLNRPALIRLLADIDAGKVDRVVVHRLDRLSRSIADCTSLLQQLQDRGIPVTLVTSPELGISAEHTFVLNILSSFAEFEQKMTRERFADVRAALKRRGHRVAGVVPYGYEVDQVTKQLVVEPREARCVRKMFHLAAEGKTPTEITEIANRRRWRTKARVSKKTGKVSGGGHWTPRQVLATLSNPVYAGLIRDGDAARSGVHQALVELEVFEQAQESVASRRTRTPGRKTRRLTLPLRGLIFCGQCDRVMSPSISGYKNFRYSYFRCRSHSGGRPPCRGVSIPTREIEQYVLNLLCNAEGWQADDRFTAEQKEKASKFAIAWSILDEATARNLLSSIIERVVFNARHGTISVTLDAQAIERLCQCDVLPNSPFS